MTVLTAIQHLPADISWLKGDNLQPKVIVLTGIEKNRPQNASKSLRRFSVPLLLRPLLEEVFSFHYSLVRVAEIFALVKTFVLFHEKDIKIADFIAPKCNQV